MTFLERELGRVFKNELEKQKYSVFDRGYTGKKYSTSFKVKLNKRVSTYSRKFKNFWLNRGLDLDDIPPSQPEIDMILIDDFGIMRAVEIKVIRKNRKRIMPSYYFGIGQTLAYLSFGFKQVALWQCFDGESLTDKEIFEYNYALMKTRIPLLSFLCVTYFRIVTEKQKLRIQTRIFYQNTSEWKDGIGIFIPETGEFSMTWDCRNPFLQSNPIISTRVRKQVNTIYEFLELQRKNLWDK